MIEYNLDNKKYWFSYRELRDKSIEIKNYSDEEFRENILDILHHLIYISYIKEIPSYLSLSDVSPIHEVIHFLKDSTLVDFRQLREDINSVIELK